MAAKTIFVFCISAYFIQTISGQCLGGLYNAAPAIIGAPGIGCGNGLGYGNAALLGAEVGVNGLINGAVATSGGSFPINTASPFPPTGLSIASENVIEGVLTAAGQLPFISAVALEGVLPTAGSGAVSYSCGDGAIGIVNEGFGAGIGYGAGLGYGVGLGGLGLAGCGGLGYNGLYGAGLII